MRDEAINLGVDIGTHAASVSKDALMRVCETVGHDTEARLVACIVAMAVVEVRYKYVLDSMIKNDPRFKDIINGIRESTLHDAEGAVANSIFGGM